LQAATGIGFFYSAMTLDQAVNLIQDCAGRMNSIYGRTVFDEWGLVSFEETPARILAYIGPRKEEFRTNFSSDLGALRSQLLGKRHAIGEFEFAHDAAGTRFEAFMVAGEEIYLVCNNTTSSLDQIMADPRWLKAQAPFAELAEKFYSSPLLPI
jgi:hypothetical protein